MTIAKGRDYRTAFIEDQILYLGITIIQSIQLFEKEKNIVQQECKKVAMLYGEGDNEVERDTFNSMYKYSSIGVLDEYMSFLREANFCFIYSTYEKLLKAIISEFTIPNCDTRKGDKNKSIVYNALFQIKQFLKIKSFEEELKKATDKINEEYRIVRVNLTHGKKKDIQLLKERLKEESDVSICDNEISFNGDRYIISFLECVRETIVAITKLVEEKSKEQ